MWPLWCFLLLQWIICRIVTKHITVKCIKMSPTGMMWDDYIQNHTTNAGMTNSPCLNCDCFFSLCFFFKLWDRKCSSEKVCLCRKQCPKKLLYVLYVPPEFKGVYGTRGKPSPMFSKRKENAWSHSMPSRIKVLWNLAWLCKIAPCLLLFSPLDSLAFGWPSNSSIAVSVLCAAAAAVNGGVRVTEIKIKGSLRRLDGMNWRGGCSTFPFCWR